MKSKTKKIISVLLLLSFLTLSLPQPARAGAWGESIYAAILKEMLEEMYLKIKETMVATLKMQAIRIVQGRLQTLLTGTPGGMGTSGLVIADWRQFIYGSANQYSTAVTNDYFKNVKSGIPQPLQQRVLDPAQKAVTMDPTKIRPDLQNFVREGKAEDIFKPGAAQNPWLAWNMAALPQNNPTFYMTTGLAVQTESFRQKEEEKKTEGQAGLGVQGVKKGGSSAGSLSSSAMGSGQKIVTPGSVIKDMITEVQSMPIKMLSLARSLPEIVASMVTQMLTQMINQGVAQITAPIDKQIMQIRNQFGLPTGQLQQYIQGGGRTVPPPSGSPLPSGFNRGGQD